MSIVQSDLALIKALNEALGYLRQNPYHLDWIFESVVGDNLNKEFGRQEIDRAKKWFLSTFIPVVSVWRLDRPQYPIVTVSVKSSVESPGKASLGEADTETFDYDETVEKQGYVPTPSVLLGPFSPGYDSTTGTVTLPDGFDTSLVFVNQQLQVPSTGNAYTITEVTSDTEFVIDTGLSENMTGAYTIPAYNSLKVVRRVSLFDEKYEINMIVAGSPGELYWLSSIIQYLLLQRRQYLLEKFNISLSSISLGEISQEQDGPENFFIRTISMDGYVENRWVDQLSEYIEGITGEVTLVNENIGPTFGNFANSVGLAISTGTGPSYSTGSGTGPQGEKGDDGPTGPMGAEGVQGPAGPVGADGADGADGTVSETTAALTVVINPATGSDTPTLGRPARLSGGNYSAEPFATRTAAYAALPKLIRHQTNVLHKPGTYSDTVTFSGFVVEGIPGGYAGVFDGVPLLRLYGEEAADTTLATGDNSGTCGAGTTGYVCVKDSDSANFTANNLVGRIVRFGSGIVTEVTANDATTFTVSVGNGTHFQLAAGDAYSFVTVAKVTGKISIGAITGGVQVDTFYIGSNKLQAAEFDYMLLSGICGPATQLEFGTFGQLRARNIYSAQPDYAIMVFDGGFVDIRNSWTDICAESSHEIFMNTVQSYGGNYLYDVGAFEAIILSSYHTGVAVDIERVHSSRLSSVAFSGCATALRATNGGPCDVRLVNTTLAGSSSDLDIYGTSYTDAQLTAAGAIQHGTIVVSRTSPTRHSVLMTFSKSGALTVAAGSARSYPYRNLAIIGITAWVGTAPVGANINFTLLQNGGSIATGVISDGSFTMTPQTSLGISLLTSDYLTVDITQIGSSIAGSDLTIRLETI